MMREAPSRRPTPSTATLADGALRVFVASTATDLKDYRTSAKQAVLDMEWQPLMMEHAPSSDRTTLDECRARVERSDLVLLIVAHQRGWVPSVLQGGNGRDSITALELEHARRMGIPVLTFLASDAWPGNLWEDGDDARQWVKSFRAGLNQPAVFFEPGDRGPESFRVQVKAELVEHKRRHLQAIPDALRLQLEPTSPGGWKGFTDWLQTQLRGTIREYNWFESSTYTEVEAEVEAELEGAGHRRQVKRVSSLQAALQQTTSRLVLVEGEPGAGKSVALRYLASALLRDVETVSGPPPLVPVYVNLRELKQNSTTVDAGVIKNEVRRRLSQGHPEWERFVERHFDAGLQAGRWLILLDSFDEIPEILGSPEPDADVRRYAEAIHEFAYGMHQCRVIVASRPYRGPGRMPWPRFRIVPLSEERRRRMVRSWFDDDDLVARILGELVAASGLAGWTSNPLLLSIVCAYRKAEGRLPSSAHDAFEGFVSRRLDDMQKVLAEHRLSSEYLRCWSERIAFRMAASSKVGLTPTRDWLRTELADEAPGDLDTILDCLTQLRFARGPRSCDAGSGFGFVHRRLQDYFATRYLLREQGEIDLTELLTNESWRETTVTLLQVGAPAKQTAILDVAVGLLEQHSFALRAEDPELLAAPPDLPVDHTAFDVLRARCTPREFPWPPGALHLLGILGSVKLGTSTAASTQPGGVHEHADALLQAAVAHGLRRDQAWALEVATAATPAMLERLLLWAFRANSRWLEDIAFERAAGLPTLPAGVAAGVRRLLNVREIHGKLRSEPTLVEAQLRRLDPSQRFIDFLRLLQSVRTADVIALSLTAGCMIGALAVSGAPMELLVGSIPPILCGAILLYLMTSLFTYWLGVGVNAAWDVRLKPRLGRRRSRFAEKPFVAKAMDLETRVLVGIWYAAFVGCSLRIAVVASLYAAFSENLNDDSLSRYALDGVAIILVLVLWYRPCAYFAVQRGRFAERWKWPLLGGALWLAVIEALFGRRWKTAWSSVAALAAYGALLPILVEALPSAGWFLGVWGGFGSGIIAVACLFTVVAECRDHFRARQLRARAGGIELEQMLRNLAGFWLDRRGVQYLRWARENGKLLPTTHGQRLLRELLIAIERDYAGALRSAPSSTLDPAWSREFADLYREFAHPKRGLMHFHGERLDELTRLAEQLQLRVRARD